MDTDQIIGTGLFDNEDDFVAECGRYNTLGDLYVGVNPRPLRLLDEYGGLKNRVRSLFVDVTTASDIDQITGVAVGAGVVLSARARGLLREASRLHDKEALFAFGSPLPAGKSEALKKWVTDSDFDYAIDQYVRVPGTALQNRGFLRPRVRFRQYRPYQLTEISDAIGEGAQGL